SIVIYSTFCAWLLSRSASLKRVDGKECVHSDYRQSARRVPVANSRASGGTDQTPDGHLRSDHWHVANGCNENIPALLVFESSMVYIDFFRRCQCQSPILARPPSMPC